MNTKTDPLGETQVVDVSAFDPHAANTVIQPIDFHAETRDLAAVNLNEPDTGLATTCWVAHATVQQTQVFAAETEVAAASPVAAPPRSRQRRTLLTVAGVLVAALSVMGVIRTRSGHARAGANNSRSTASSAHVGVQLTSRSAAPSTTQAPTSAASHLTPEQVQALEKAAVSALFAADEAVAIASYRALAATGHDVAQRVVLLLERAP